MYIQFFALELELSIYNCFAEPWFVKLDCLSCITRDLERPFKENFYSELDRVECVYNYLEDKLYLLLLLIVEFLQNCLLAARY